MRHLILSTLLVLTPTLAAAQQIQFGPGWTEQRFSMFSSNDYTLGGDTLQVRSDDTVSLLWSRLPETMWNNRRASWDWTVERSVPATDLTRKGGDDRNMSLYFLFLPDEVAAKAKSAGVMSLLDNDDARVLIYVWGGAHDRGQILPTPYLGERGRSLIRRSAGTGTASETVDLAADHRRAFGTEPGSLVGLAVSSDSDDTGTEVVARLSRLRIGK